MVKLLLCVPFLLPLSIRAQERVSSLRSEVEHFSYRIDRFIGREHLVIGNLNALQIAVLRLKDLETAEQKSGIMLKTAYFEAIIDSFEVAHFIRRLNYLKTVIQNTNAPQNEHIWFVTNSGLKIDVISDKYVRTHFDTQEHYTVYEWSIYINKYPFENEAKYILETKKLETLINILTAAQTKL